MNIDWASLGLVAITTVVAAVAIIGIYSLGVLALTAGARNATEADSAEGERTAAVQSSGAARIAGYACIGISGLLVLYGLYLIIPQFH